MKRYKSILCALDLGDNCGTLIEAALNFEPTTLRLLHVCEHPITGFGESTGHNLRVTEAQIRQQMFPRINGFAKRYDIGMEHTEILFGNPAEVIHSCAEDNQCALIVIGSHCKPGLTRLLGSTTSNIIHGAPCDILTVRLE